MAPKTVEIVGVVLAVHVSDLDDVLHRAELRELGLALRREADGVDEGELVAGANDRHIAGDAEARAQADGAPHPEDVVGYQLDRTVGHGGGEFGHRPIIGWGLGIRGESSVREILRTDAAVARDGTISGALGLRPGLPPLERYRSGDRLLRAQV